MPGRDEVVGEQDDHRERRAEAGRDRAAPPRPAAADEHEERRRRRATVRRAVHASPNRRPTRNWRRSDRAVSAGVGRGRASVASSTSAPARRRRSPPRSAPSAKPDGEHREADRDDMGEVPGRAELRRVPEDRAEREEDGRREPDPTRSGSRPSTHQAIPTSSAAEDRRTTTWIVRREPPERDERHEHDGGQRRERNQRPRRDAVDRCDRQHVLEVLVARIAAGVDRVADRGLALEERGRLPDEVVVGAVAAGRACTTARATMTRPTPTDGRRATAPTARRDRDPAGGPQGDPVLRSRSTSRSCRRPIPR